jgi:hypothetical protein
VKENAMSMTRRDMLAAAVVGGLATTGAAHADEKPKERPKLMTPEEVAKDRPAVEVTVRFRVEDGGTLGGVMPEGSPPYEPVVLESAAAKGGKGRMSVLIGGRALVHIHHLGIDQPVAYFRGKVVAATGKVHYQQTGYQIVVDNLDHFEVKAS